MTTTRTARPADQRQPAWPEEAAQTTAGRRRDWRDTIRLATDLALLGIAVTLAALPVLTAGAAVATGSAAMRHFLEDDRWPPAATLLRIFRRRLAPGLLAGPAVLAAAGLVVLDVRGLQRGAVPGGAPMIAVVLAVTALAAGYAAAALVSGAARSRPRTRLILAATGILLVVAVLVMLVHPVLVAVLIGYALFALHVVARRLV